MWLQNSFATLLFAHCDSLCCKISHFTNDIHNKNDNWRKENCLEMVWFVIWMVFICFEYCITNSNDGVIASERFRDEDKLVVGRWRKNIITIFPVSLSLSLDLPFIRFHFIWKDILWICIRTIVHDSCWEHGGYMHWKAIRWAKNMYCRYIWNNRKEGRRIISFSDAMRSDAMQTWISHAEHTFGNFTKINNNFIVPYQTRSHICYAQIESFRFVHDGSIVHSRAH